MAVSTQIVEKSASCTDGNNRERGGVSSLIHQRTAKGVLRGKERGKVKKSDTVRELVTKNFWQIRKKRGKRLSSKKDVGKNEGRSQRRALFFGGEALPC